jgi:hypothetical protein
VGDVGGDERNLNDRPWAGELVVENFDYDNGREGSAYLPPGRASAVVFAADAGERSPCGVRLSKSRA